MIHRKYPKRIKGQLQTSKVRCVRLDAQGQAAFDKISAALMKGYKIEDKPSLGLIMQSVLIQFTQSMTTKDLKSLHAEILAHGCVPPKKHLHEVAEALAVAKTQTLEKGN
jgi:hypothetical protein